MGDNMEIINLNTNETLKTLNTSINGLNDKEVKIRIKKYGKNKFYLTNSIFKSILSQIFKPYFLILIFFIFSTLIIKSYYNSIIIGIALLLNIIFDILLNYKNEYPIILEKLSIGKTLVIRNGKKTKIKPKYLTVGDIVVIKKNNIIKADIKIITENNIKIKSPLNNNYSDENNILYAGDYILDGSGMGVVFAIGKNTEIYKISKKISTKNKQGNPFKEYLKKLNKKLLILTIITLILEILLLYLKKKKNIFIINQLSKLTLFLTPLPILILLFFILYFNKNKFKNTSFNNLYSILNVGNISTIILDKNFLTLNELTAKIIQLEDDSVYEVEGNGYNCKGDIIPINSSAKYKDSLYYLSMIGKLISLGNNLIIDKNNTLQNFSNEVELASNILNKKINNVTYESNIIKEIKNENYTILFYKENNITKFCIRGNVEKILNFYKGDTESILNKANNLKNLNYIVIGIFEGQIEKSKNKKKLSEKDIKNLNFIGIVGFIKPLKDNSATLIETLKKEDIRLIITDNQSSNYEHFAKSIDFTIKKSQIVNNEDIKHNFNLGKRIFNDFVNDIKIISNVNKDNLIKIINSLKKQGETIAFINNDIENNDIVTISNISISENNSIDNYTDFKINELENIIDNINKSKRINETIDKLTKHFWNYKFLEILSILTAHLFNNLFNISIIQILLLNLSFIILTFLLIKNNKNCKESKCKGAFILLLNYFFILLFIVFTNICKFKFINIDSSIIFLILYSQVILLYYYQNNENSIFNWKNNWKDNLIITVYSLILVLSFMARINIFNFLILLGIILIIIAIIEFKKSRNAISN